MLDILDKVIAVAKALTDTENFPDRSGTQVVIPYYRGIMPAKEGEHEDLPFCLVKSRAFGMFPMRGQVVELYYVLHNTSRKTGLADINRLYALLEADLAKSNPKAYKPWKLDDASGWTGDEENGIQPHPVYTMNVVLEFASPRTTI